MRKNIFDRMREFDYNVEYELYKIHELFREVSYCFRATPYSSSSFSETGRISVEGAVDKFKLLQWKQNRTITSLNELRTRLGINNLYKLMSEGNVSEAKLDLDDVTIYLEYILNVVYLGDLLIERGKATYKVDIQSNPLIYNAMLSNINTMLDNLNLEVRYIENEEKAILTPKDATVTAVAEIIGDELFLPTIEYNHHSLQGNIERKQEILLKFAYDLAPKRSTLKNLSASIEDNLFFMFNKFNVRKDNSVHGKDYVEYTANLGSGELEKYYDEIYKLALHSYLILDSADRLKMFKDLKRKISNKETP